MKKDRPYIVKSAHARKRGPGPGRPPTVEWPDNIPDTPENVLRAVLNAPAKGRGEWEYEKDVKSGRQK